MIYTDTCLARLVQELDKRACVFSATISGNLITLLPEHKGQPCHSSPVYIRPHVMPAKQLLLILRKQINIL